MGSCINVYLLTMGNKDRRGDIALGNIITEGSVALGNRTLGNRTLRERTLSKAGLNEGGIVDSSRIGDTPLLFAGLEIGLIVAVLVIGSQSLLINS